MFSFQDIHNKVGNSPNRILEHNAVEAAINKFVHSSDDWNIVDTELSDLLPSL